MGRLVTTTSALGTSCIMRRCAISRCIWRMRPLTSGRPLGLPSSRTSCCVIFSSFLCCQSWNGTSISAIRISVEANATDDQATSVAPLPIGWAISILLSPSRSSLSACSRTTVAPPDEQELGQ